MSVYVVSFTVPWVHGWQRAGVNLKSGEHFTRGQTEADEEEIALRYAQACRAKYGKVLKAPKWAKVTLVIDAYLPPPKRWPKYLPKWLKPIIPFVVTPDADNIAKLMDGLNGIAWVDDAQVTRLVVNKHDRNGTSKECTVFTLWWKERDD